MLTLIEELHEGEAKFFYKIIATHLGEKEEVIEEIIFNLYYFILGGIIKRSTTDSGLSLINRLIQQSQQDGKKIEQQDEYFESKEHFNHLLSNGITYLGHILPDKKSSIAGAVRKWFPISNSNMINLEALTVILLLYGLYKKQKSESGEDPNKLADKLNEIKNTWFKNYPSEKAFIVLDVLGLDNSESITIAPTPTEPEEEIRKDLNSVENNNSDSDFSFDWSKLKYAAIIALLAGVGYGIWYVLNTPASPSVPKAVVVNDTVKLKEYPVQKEDTLLVKELGDYLKDSLMSAGKLITIKRVVFSKNSDTLKVKGALVSILDLVKKYHKTTFKVVCFVEPLKMEESKNKNIATGRANSIRKYFVENGIASERIEIIGAIHKINKPVETWTEEDKEQANRTEIRITAK